MNEKTRSLLTRTIICTIGSLIILITAFLFVYIFWMGRNVMSISFILDEPSGVPIGTSGGIFPALIGSVYLGVIGTTIGGIPAVLLSAYLSFYKTKSSRVANILSSITRTSIIVLSGIPSILFGLIGYTVMIQILGIGRSLIVSSICIGIMMIPFISIRSLKIFNEKGTEIMNTALSLGLSREYTLIKIIIPECSIELIGTLAIGMAYGMGAVAPILYTGAVMQADIPKSIFDPFMSLPYHLYMLVNNGFSIDYAYGTAFVLMAFLLFIQIIFRLGKYIRNLRGDK